jgi:hypothetical protein
MCQKRTPSVDVNVWIRIRRLSVAVAQGVKEVNEIPETLVVEVGRIQKSHGRAVVEIACPHGEPARMGALSEPLS